MARNKSQELADLDKACSWLYLLLSIDGTSSANDLGNLKGNKRETEKEGTSKQKEGTLASVYRYTTRVVLPTGPDADYLSVRRSGPTNLSLAPSPLKPVTYLGQRRKRVPHLMMQGTRRLSPSLARDARKVLITGVRIQPFIAPKLRFL